ncbi:MAG: TniB family NTP-binding protein [Methylobacter sp.]
MFDQSALNQTWAVVSRLIIKHPAFNEAYQLLKEAYLFNQQTGLTKNYWVVGPTGTGKTTLMDMLVKEFPPVERVDRKSIPVLAINIPALPTIKNLAEEMLVQLGDPIFYRGSAIDKTIRILHLIKACDVKLILFDEMQHFVDRGHKRAPAEVADWLKTLIDKALVSTVIMGLERTQIILDANEQLRRRFCRRIDLKPFDLECPTSRSHFLGVIKKIDEALDMSSRLDLQQDGLVRQLHFATNGTMDYMVKLMLGAYQIAINRQLPGIDRQCLEQAFSDSIWVEGVGKMNPFNPQFIGQRLDKRGMVFYKAPVLEVIRSKEKKL